MNSTRIKKIAIFFIVGILACIVLIIKIIYFGHPLNPRPYDDNVNLQEIGNIIKKISYTTTSFYDKFTHGISFFKTVFKAAQGNNFISLENIEGAEQLKEDLIKKLDERNINRLDPKILEIKKITPQNLRISLTTIEKSFATSSVARITLENPEQCQISYELYLQKYTTEMGKAIETYNKNIIKGMCEKKLMNATSTYVILDTCSNRKKCDGDDEMEGVIKKWFNF